MPVFAVKAASMSSSAFFIEAAANTVRLLSWARAGEWTVPHRMTKAAKSPARRCMAALHTCLRRMTRANQALVKVAEAPFPGSLRLTVDRDIADKTIHGCRFA